MVVNNTWSVVSDGSYRYEGSHATASAITETGDSSWTNYTIEATVKGTDLDAAHAAFYLLGRYADENNYYTFGYSKELGGLAIRKKVNASWTTLGTVYSFTPSENTDYTLRGEMNGHTLTLYLDGVQRVSATDTTFSTGKIGLQVYQSTARFDDVIVRK